MNLSVTWDWKKIRKYFDTEETEIVFVERPRRFLSPLRRKIKTTKPRIQAKNRIFNGNSRSARTAPLKILTPAPRVFVLLNSAPKSPKISSATLRKAHPPSVYKVFSALIQSALSQIIPNSTNKKQRPNFFDYDNCLSALRF